MSSLSALRRLRRVLLDARLLGGGIVSRRGMAGMSSPSSGVSDKTFNSLLAFLAEPIDPRSVNVPSAKTEAVTIESVASAMMLDVKSVITYC